MHYFYNVFFSSIYVESTYSHPLGHCHWMPVTCTVSASTVEYPPGLVHVLLSTRRQEICVSFIVVNNLKNDIAVLQVEALCALKRHQEAAETLDTIAQHDRSFSKSKDFKSLLKQVQAVA